MALKPENFDFELPAELIAQRPPARRDASRLLNLGRSGGILTDHSFSDLPQLLRRGDLLVMNDTLVIPARFRCTRSTGGRVEGLFLRVIGPGRWEVMLKNAGRCRIGESLTMIARDDTDPTAIVLAENLGRGRWVVAPDGDRDALDILQAVGTIPLPPYIHRNPDYDDSDDRRRYQTVYAARPGAVAAPTAGLHFTPEVFNALTDAGVSACCLTLHVGAGTFLPVKTDDLAGHQMHTETYELSDQTAQTINEARDDGRRIVAVGTTTVRVLETLAARTDRFAPTRGETDIFIYPPEEFRAVDALITNFHLPRSTLLMLVSAFCSPGSVDGVEMMLSAYRHAVESEYRFFSYGDAMLIE
ncbi:MAG: tRNA preQ1(34) S-adenosylmethionine ribosyltransferase-isomerase QueA [Phycisphaerae bacterium]|jgi:S-adenosylmethionine:tRNA ribosyltransferase-isomerase|nr:tRNA preQ1(34) S-adenosylmethionine ribosyltransferase-isomerase QueA [Phycisphaerae bacterium]